MSNFLDLDPPADEPAAPEQPVVPALKDLLARVPPTPAPRRLHPELSDRLAEVHGFASREASAAGDRFYASPDAAPAAPDIPASSPEPVAAAQPAPPAAALSAAPNAGRRMVRGVPVEDSRQLSIRMPVSLYNDFLAFADRERLTYNEAIRELLNRAEHLQSMSGNGVWVPSH